MVRVDDRFRIVALGLPVPRYPGNPLDPPLRSRFQARSVRSDPAGAAASLAGDMPRLAAVGDLAATLAQLARGGGGEEAVDAVARMPELSCDALRRLRSLAAVARPEVELGELLHPVFPHTQLPLGAAAGIVESALSRYGLDSAAAAGTGAAGTGGLPEFEVPLGTLSPGAGAQRIVPAPSQEALLGAMFRSHAVADFCLLGGRGVGKSAVVAEFARRAGYDVRPVLLHRDMSSRDLLQQRATDAAGDTVWTDTPLVTAACDGGLALLDGMHRVEPSTLSVIARLAQDRECALNDGTRLVGAERYAEIAARSGLDDAGMTERGFRRIHPVWLDRGRIAKATSS